MLDTLPMTSRPTTKTGRIEIRVTEEERNLEQAAAAIRGEALSEASASGPRFIGSLLKARLRTS
jgi:hypothetical protein